MILPFDKFKQYCYLKNNTNKLNFEYYKTVTNCSKEIFDYFSNNVNFESWFNLMLANNINDDTKRLLFYAAYDNFSYDRCNSCSKLKANKYDLCNSFDVIQCILNFDYCYYKLIIQKQKNCKSDMATKQQINIVYNKLKQLKNNNKIYDFALSPNSASDIVDNDVKKIDGIVNIDRDNIIKVLASYITTSGGNQIDKVNTENLAMINSKAIRIFDGQGAIALYQTQQYKQGNNKNIFITCASCIEDAVEFFKQ